MARQPIEQKTDLFTINHELVELDYTKRLLKSPYNGNAFYFPENPRPGAKCPVFINDNLVREATIDDADWHRIFRIPADLPDRLKTSSEVLNEITLFGKGFGNVNIQLLTNEDAKLLKGIKPITLLAGIPYEVDISKNQLKPLDNIGPSISLNQFEEAIVDGKPVLRAYFESKSRLLKDPLQSPISQDQFDMWQVTLPTKRALDPVAWATSEYLPPHFGFGKGIHYEPITDHSLPLTKEEWKHIRSGDITTIAGIYPTGISHLNGDQKFKDAIKSYVANFAPQQVSPVNKLKNERINTPLSRENETSQKRRHDKRRGI